MDLIGVIPDHGSVKAQRVQSFLPLADSAGVYVLAVQNQGSTCGGGTPINIWKMYFDTATNTINKFVFKQSLPLIQEIRNVMIQSTDKTIFTGGGWCGTKPPYYSTDQGETWHAANTGVYPPSSTFSLCELNGTVYAGTGYMPYHGEVYKWLGTGGVNNWEKVLDVGIERNIVGQVVTHKEELYIGSQLYQSATCNGTVPVYRTSNGVDFIPTTGIPSCYSMIKLLIVNDTLVSSGGKDNDHYMYKWDKINSQWLQTGHFSMALFNIDVFISTGQKLFIYGKMGSDATKGIYMSDDAGRRWSRILELDSVDIQFMKYHKGRIFAASSGEKAYIYMMETCETQYVTVNLSFCKEDSISLNSKTYRDEGIYHDTLVSSCGKDSILVINVSHYPNYLVDKQTYICPDDSIYLESGYRKHTGIYTDTLFTNYGCDSVIRTQLSLLPVYSTDIDTSLCENDSILLNGQYIKEEGNHIYHLSSVNFCDSTVTYHITVNPGYEYVTDTAICEGETITMHGIPMNNEDRYSVIYSTTCGCDSIFYVNVQLKPSPDVDLSNGITINPGNIVLLDAGPDFEEYLWSNGSTTQKVIIDQSFGSGQANIWVRVKNNQECTASDTLSLFIQVSGTEEYSLENNIRIFPNPAHGAIIVSIDPDFSQLIREITIMDTSGKRLPLQPRRINDTFIFDIQKKGLYLLKISTDRATLIKKIILL